MDRLWQNYFAESAGKIRGTRIGRQMEGYKQAAPKATGKKGLEKEKRDNEMKVAVDRLWQHYAAKR